jgi:hypothetical protein
MKARFDDEAGNSAPKGNRRRCCPYHAATRFRDLNVAIRPIR